MKPFYADDWLTVYGGDCREVLASLPSDSVDCVVTSPPYWGLRDYGAEGQLGLEPTPEEYVANMVAVFAEVRRVLKPSGTCWLNLGDSYAGSGKGGNPAGSEWSGFVGNGDREKAAKASPPYLGLAQKQLVGIPWRVAFALQADGWYLRSDIIWSKPNPMPESVTDRPTKSHEYLFLLTKSARYFFDNEAVREPEKPWNAGWVRAPKMGAERINGAGKAGTTEKQYDTIKGANIRSVWTIATRPYPGAHFAVFPPELPERCIKAGSSERGVCPECGAPWERVVERGEPVQHHWAPGTQAKRSGNGKSSSVLETGTIRPKLTVAWRVTCEPMHSIRELPEPAVILDPFGGSGTVGMVANRLSRRGILIDLNPEYLKQQMKRNAQTPLGLDVA